MKIKEIMSTNVLSVKENTPILEVAKMMSENRIHAVPVVDSENKVLGIITETDFFTKDSANMSYIPSLIDFACSGEAGCDVREKEAMRAVVHAQAKDIMSEKCKIMSPDTDVQDFIKTIKETGFNSYPVADEQGVIMGIVTVADAIKLL